MKTFFIGGLNMSDNKVIISSQRNTNDVAIELTQYYLNRFENEHLTKEEFSEIYKFFYKTAVYANREL